MRCIALAEAFAALEHKVIFAMSQASVGFLPSSFPSAWSVAVMSGDARREPAEMASALGSDGHLIVIDHYGRDAAFERACKALAGRVLAWDDQPNRAHDCDFVLDTGSDMTADEYAPRVRQGSRLLLGPRYAPLRADFAKLRPAALARRDGRRVRRIFISFGATDPAGATLTALDAVNLTGLDVHVDVAIGGSAPHLAALKARCTGKVALHIDAPDVADLMLNADLAIGAGGSTSWERCCLGLPTIVATIADNQHAITRTLAQAGAAFDLGLFNPAGVTVMADAIVAIATDPARRCDMAKAAAALVDGHGGRRVVGAVEELAG